MQTKYQYFDYVGREYKQVMKKVLYENKCKEGCPKNDWNKLWHQTQCTSTSLLHFDV